MSISDSVEAVKRDACPEHRKGVLVHGVHRKAGHVQSKAGTSGRTTAGPGKRIDMGLDRTGPKG